MTEKNLVNLIGQPEKKGALEFQGGTEEYHQAWLYPVLAGAKIRVLCRALHKTRILNPIYTRQRASKSR